MTNQIVDELDVEIGYVSDRERVKDEKTNWSYIGASINFQNNKFRIWTDPPIDTDELEVIVLKHRQFKRYEDENGKKFNLSKYAKEGEPHAQFLFVKPDDPTQIYNFGTGSYTARASLFNTEKGAVWHNSDLPLGIFNQLDEHIKNVEVKTKRKTNYTDWKFTLKLSEDKITVGTKGKSQQVHYIVRNGFKYVGTELAKTLDDLYHAEELNDWFKQYEQGKAVEEPDYSNSEPVIPNPYNEIPPEDTDDIPF